MTGHLFNAIVSPRTRGPWRGVLPPTLSIVLYTMCNLGCSTYLFVFFHNSILVAIVTQHTTQAINGLVDNLLLLFFAMYTSVALESNNIYALWEPDLDCVNISIV